MVWACNYCNELFDLCAEIDKHMNNYHDKAQQLLMREKGKVNS